jgi:hypothetical protein
VHLALIESYVIIGSDSIIPQSPGPLLDHRLSPAPNVRSIQARESLTIVFGGPRI